MKSEKKYTNISTKRIVSFIREVYKKFPKKTILTLIFRILRAASTLFPAIFYKDIIDVLSNTLQASPEIAIHAIAILLYILWIKLFTVLVSRITDYFLIALEMDGQRELYTQTFDYLLKHSLQFFSDNYTGSLIKKVTKMTTAYERVTDILVFDIMRFILDCIIILTVVGIENIRFSIIFFFGMVGFIAIQYKLYMRIQPYQDKANALDSQLGGLLSDDITNNYNIKTFASLPRESRNFENLTKEAMNARKTQYYKMMRIRGSTGVFTVLMEIGLIYLAINLRGQGIISIGVIVLLQTYILRLMEQMRGIGHIFRNFFRSMSEIGEMIEILDTPHSIVDHSNKKLKVDNGDILFDQIDFSYDNKNPVFQNLTLKIKPGERIALVGPSGGGKTTIGKLLFRFYDIEGGKILVDGQDISQVSQDSLRSQIGMVPQDPILFHRSIKENIIYGKPNATEEEIIAAAKMARCADFIEKLPHKYDTLVGERGIKLSGGERQRVAIARAILQNAPILLMDEATSALDSESEQLIQEAMESLMQNKTVIVIAHRLSTIMKMDKIIVIEDGKITESGTHGELLLKKGEYAKLWDIQSGGFIRE